VVGAFSDTVFSCLVGSWARQDGLNAMVAHIRDDHIPGWMICECVAHFDVVEAHVGDKLRHGHQPMDLVDSQVFDVAACHFHTLAPAFSDFFNLPQGFNHPRRSLFHAPSLWCPDRIAGAPTKLRYD
jgi:hypothetical protein